MDRKAALRARIATAREGHDHSAAIALADRVLGLPELSRVRIVAAYVGHGHEVPTLPLLDRLARRGAQVLLPVVGADGAMSWAAYDGSLVPGRYGIPVPTGPAADLATAEAVLVPGVAFDPAGGRLGRGGGHYDRTLAGLPPHVPVIGLAADSAIVDAVPTEPHDRPVDLVVTPTRVLRCTPRRLG